jgi:hypothetical protein
MHRGNHISYQLNFSSTQPYRHPTASRRKQGLNRLESGSQGGLDSRSIVRLDSWSLSRLDSWSLRGFDHWCLGRLGSRCLAWLMRNY